MIPIKDTNPSRSFPVVNLSIIIICSILWLYEAKLDKSSLNIFIYNYGLVPSEAFSKLYQLFTHMFLHGSWLHIIGNMWFLWVFGDNVEDKLGKLKYIVFYTLSGVGAGLIQTIISFLTGSQNIPMVGASGAISGVLGAYLYLFPHARILAIIPVFFFSTLMEVPAVFFIGMWILVQVLNGLLTLPFASVGGVAWFAHIGGFFIGYKLVKVFRRRYYN